MGFVGDAIGAIGGFLGSNAGSIAKGAGNIIGGAMSRGAGGTAQTQDERYKQWQQSQQNPYQNIGSDLIRSAMMGRFQQQGSRSPTAGLMSLGRQRYG